MQDVRPFSSDLAIIAARASTVMERLAGPFVPQSAPDDPVIVRRLEDWCKAVAKGDRTQFHHRLRWDGLDEAAIRRVLGDVSLRDGAELPEWTKVVAEAAEREWTPGELARVCRPDPPIPFEEVLAPFVLLADERLRLLAGEAIRELSSKARDDLALVLLSRLSSLAARTLFLEFSRTRSRELSSFALLLTREGERELYDRFVASLRGAGLIAFFHKHPVLARVIGTSVILWAEAHAEMMQRLTYDGAELQRIFGRGRELGAVEGVQSALSDPHHRGRTVVSATFQGGQQVVYKPKGLGTEVAFNAVLEMVNRSIETSGGQNRLLPLRMLKVLDRETHGWVEFVRNEPCSDVQGARRYYLRAGMLLALLYALGGSDCHMENLIACGDSPVLIDLETLLRPEAVQEDTLEEAGASNQAQEQLVSSVIRVGLLPTWQLDSDGRTAYDISGLGSLTDQEASMLRQEWRETNTDRMAVADVRAKVQAGGNVATLDGKPLHLDAFAADLEAGFEGMYRFLIDRRETLLDPGSPLAALAEKRVRFVFRPTRIYVVLQRQLLDAPYLQDGVDWSIGMEVLARAGMPQSQRAREAGERSIFWPLIAAEREALIWGDIPYFAAAADSTCLSLPSGPVMCFEASGLDRAAQALKTMDDADLRRQLAIIQGTIYSFLARGPEVSSASAETESSGPDGEAGPGDDLVSAALEIAADISERAIRDPDGSLAWIVPHYLIQAERYQLLPSGPDLYDGGAGVALFFAALERVTGAGYRDLALGALQPFRRELRQYGKRAARHSSIGAATGIASMVYALVGACRFLDDPDLLADAHAAAQLITADRIANDHSLDVIHGSAGAILGLLSLFEADADRDALERALQAGEHLLKSRKESPAGPRAWPTIDAKLMTGFSHGAAGIAYALSQLYRASGENAFVEASAEGISYEDAVFVREKGNWPDFRQDPPTFMSAWCHGATGIGLARLGGLGALDSPQIRSDLDTALATTESQRVDRHITCCGAMGRVELLLCAGLELGVPRLVQRAHGLTNRVLQQRRAHGGFRVHRPLPAIIYNPGLFQGTAGIGYIFLRLSKPDVVPPFLLWR
jgi:type 2 lantibiotic biosynthesis protein LanM